MAPATGFKQSFYFSMMAWFAKQGYAALTFDNRGIGTSKNNIPMHQQTATLVDWGCLDMVAALDHLQSLAPGVSVSLVGHSAGAQLIGLMPNHIDIDRYVLLGASSGHFNHLAFKTRLGAHAIFDWYLPISNVLFGYWKTNNIGFGQDLPRGVAKQWQKWCSSPGYMANDFGQAIKTHYYNDITRPMLALAATDDHIAVPANVNDFLRFLPNAKIDQRHIAPATLNAENLGHNGWFRSSGQAYWPEILGWIENS